MKKGCFITFEGIDGSGKTTQLNSVKNYLENNGYSVVVTREPGALNVGKKIREILLHSNENISDKCEMFLFLADRANHIQNFIEPALNQGKIVLCDRHTDSTIAYQGYGRGQNIELLKKLNDIATGNIKPDLTLLYDISMDTSFKRVGTQKDRMELSGLEFYEHVRLGYIELQKENPERIKIINANKSINDVFEDTKQLINELLKKD